MKDINDIKENIEESKKATIIEFVLDLASCIIEDEMEKQEDYLHGLLKLFPYKVNLKYLRTNIFPKKVNL